LQALADSPDGWVRDAVALLPEQGADPWAVVRKTQSGWWVVTEVSDREAMAGQRRALFAVWGAMAVALALLAAGLFWVLRRGVSQPLRGLTQALTLVAQGDLTQPFHSPRRDEIGDLVREVEDMRQRYVAMLQQVSLAAHNMPAPAARLPWAMPIWPSAPTTPQTGWRAPPAHGGHGPGRAPGRRCGAPGTPAVGLGRGSGFARR
jgi:methyl-accepting chemotaxis protein-2 (aspartate sensor receptor)